MNITRLVIKGFKSFDAPQCIDFSSLHEGIYFVTGTNNVSKLLEANGSGKSTAFVDALCWVLFGKTSTKLRADNVKNWNGKNKCEICLEFDGNTLVRTWNPNSLTLNGRTITQDELEKLIRFNFNSFLYSVVISQFGEKFIDYDPADKMRIFTSILEDILSKWDTHSDKAKEKRDLCESLIRQLELEISKIEGQLKSIDIKDLQLKYEQFEFGRNKKIKELQQKLDEIVPINTKDIYIEIEEFENTKTSLEQELKAKYEIINSLQAKLDEVKEHHIRVQYGLDNITKAIAKMHDLEGLTSCPLCKHSLTKEHIAKELGRLAADKEKLSGDDAKFNLEITAIKNEIDGWRSIIKTLDVKKSEVETSLRELINKKVAVEEAIKNQKIMFAYISKQILEQQNAINPYTSLISKAQQQIKELQTMLGDKKTELLGITRDFEAYKYWVKGFKEIKLMLTSEALHEFEIQINNALTGLGMLGWSVKLKVDAETKSGILRKGFNIFIESPSNSTSVPFECWSGGEGQRIRLATTLGLIDFIKNRRGSSCNILVFDEPTQFLSEKGIEDLIMTLKEKASSDNLKLFLIDHRNLQTFGDFDGIISVIKDAEGSRIEMR